MSISGYPADREQVVARKDRATVCCDRPARKAVAAGKRVRVSWVISDIGLYELTCTSDLRKALARDGTSPETHKQLAELVERNLLLQQQVDSLKSATSAGGVEVSRSEIRDEDEEVGRHPSPAPPPPYPRSLRHLCQGLMTGKELYRPILTCSHPQRSTQPSNSLNKHTKPK